MNVEHIRMSGNLNLYTVNLHQLVSFLNVFLVNEVIGIAWVHYDNNPVLNTLLADGEHYLVELIFACPLFRFIADESRNALNGFQFCSLVPGRSLDTLNMIRLLVILLTISVFVVLKYFVVPSKSIFSIISGMIDIPAETIV